MKKRSGLAWGILGCGAIAEQFASALRKSTGGHLVAVGSRDLDRARSFARLHGGPAAYGDYEALLADKAVEAVYIATPHPMHLEWILRAAEHGKHVLCEKPLTMNAFEADQACAACARAGVVLMEAFMYRCHPMTTRWLDVIRSGEIGELRLIQAAMGFYGGDDLHSRLLDPALGGGGILDVGCYTVSAARLAAGAALGKPVAEPVSVKGHARLHPVTGVDVYAHASLRFEGDILASCVCGVGLSTEGQPGLRLQGSEGWLEVAQPWFGKGTVRWGRYEDDAPVESWSPTGARPLYAYEADVFARAVEAGRVSPPAPDGADAAANMAVLDRWRAEIGLRYAADAVVTA